MYSARSTHSPVESLFWHGNDSQLPLEPLTSSAARVVAYVRPWRVEVPPSLT